MGLIRYWDGIGEPIAGSICEWSINGDQMAHTVEVLYIGDSFVVLKFLHIEGGPQDGAYPKDDSRFYMCRSIANDRARLKQSIRHCAGSAESQLRH